MKDIQRLLVQAGYSLTVDGDYGVKTAGAVSAFQRSNGLKPVDGITGPVTLSALKSATGKTPVALSSPEIGGNISIVTAHISSHITKCSGRSLKYIAIHYTAGTTSRNGAALSMRRVFLNRNASADYVVDDEQIVEINPDVRNYYCWSVGDKKNIYTGGGKLYGIAANKNTVNVEICSTLRPGFSASVPNHDGWYFSDKVLDNAVRLIRWLMEKYGIPKGNIVRHFDITGKLCPGVPGWNDGAIYSSDGKTIVGKSSSVKFQEFLRRI